MLSIGETISISLGERTGLFLATITDPNVSMASAANPTYLVGMTCSVQGGSWKCGCRDTSCTNFSWQIQGAGQ